MLFGSPETTSGAGAQVLRLGPGFDVRRIESLKDGPEVVGNRTWPRWSRTSWPRRSARPSSTSSTVRGSPRRAACSTSAWTSASSRSPGPGSPTNGDQLGQGRENSRNFLRDNPELAREIEEKIKAQLGVGLACLLTTDPVADKQPKDPDKL